MLLTLAALLSLLAPGSSAAATIHYVVPGDNIQLAIDLASPGDIIQFALGTYSLPATLDVNRSLTLKSADPYAPTKPILDGGSSLPIIVYIDADNVTIDGLEICNGTGDLVSQADTSGYDPDPSPHSGTTITNCVVHGSWGPGDDGIELKQCTNGLVKCNLVYDVAQDGIAIAGNSHSTQIVNDEIHHSYSENGAIFVYDSYDITVKGNYIHDTQAANGIKMDDNYGSTHTIASNRVVHNSWQGGKRAYDEADGNSVNIYKPRLASSYVVTHNTLSDNTGVDGGGNPTGHAIYVNDYVGTGFVTDVRDNIIANHSGYGIRTYYGAAVSFSYNDLWQNALGATDGNPADAGSNIYLDPLFNADYTLQPGSPAITAASDGNDMGVVFAECGCEPESPGDGDDDSGACFIATAAYGSYMDDGVQTLRTFRDSYLVTSSVGSGLVSVYYRLSPPVAQFVDTHSAMKPLVRAGLMPAVTISEVAVDSNLSHRAAMAGSTLLASVLLAVWLRRKVVQRRRHAVKVSR